MPALFLKALQRFKQIHNSEDALSLELFLSNTIKKKSEMDMQDLKGMVAHAHTDAAGILLFRKYSAQHWHCKERTCLVPLPPPSYLLPPCLLLPF